jgi:hypothetical protein
MTERDQQGTIDDPEVPEEDALEQRGRVGTAVRHERWRGAGCRGDLADVAESRSVAPDDDEYR